MAMPTIVVMLSRRDETKRDQLMRLVPPPVSAIHFHWWYDDSPKTDDSRAQTLLALARAVFVAVTPRLLAAAGWRDRLRPALILARRRNPGLPIIAVRLDVTDVSGDPVLDGLRILPISGDAIFDAADRSKAIDEITRALRKAEGGLAPSRLLRPDRPTARAKAKGRSSPTVPSVAVEEISRARRIAEDGLPASKPPEPDRPIAMAKAKGKSSPAGSPEVVLRDAFPEIAPDDAHPTGGSVVTFTVTIERVQSKTTTGKVRLPRASPDIEHTLKVHLRFGIQSAWDSLTFSFARGTSKSASFKLLTPVVDGERASVEVRANFYLNQRWCGEGQRNLDVRRDATVPALDAIPLPEEPRWRQGLELDPGALPPDLIVRIQKEPLPGDFVWSCLSPHIELLPPNEESDARMSLGGDAATFVRRTFAPLASMPLDRLRIADVRGAGEQIYRNTPKHFRDCYWRVWNAAAAGGFSFESIQIITDEPCVPWELMRIHDKDRAPEVKAEFLAIRHSVGRWLANESSSMRQRIAVHKVAVSASDYEGIDSVSNKLPWAAKEREFMVETYKAAPVSLTSNAMLDFLENEHVQAVHLACHGKMSVSDPEASLLVMEDTPNDLNPRLIARSEVCDGLGSEHPLVFLNACEIGGTGASLSLISGFPAAFLHVGASAVVSPLWAVNDEHARHLAENFYKEVFVAGGGETLGGVLRDLRKRWESEKHLTFLAYVLYGDPLARVDYAPLP